MSDYAAVPSAGKLKLKGVKDGRIDKKKKKKTRNEGPETDNNHVEDKSVVLKALEDEDKITRKEKDRKIEASRNEGNDNGSKEEEDVDVREHLKTEAEKRYDEQRRKRLEERLKKEGVKTHKERVEELNKYLSNLSEHHDMPKIGPG